MLELQPGATIVEIGCGVGILAGHFVKRGYRYFGIDKDAERIAAARAHTPHAQFEVGDAGSLSALKLPDTLTFYIHGVLHHLDDETCRKIVRDVLAIDAKVRLALTEPIRPSPWIRNPLGLLFAWLDEGEFVRSENHWRDLLDVKISDCSTRSLWPRWPVTMMDALVMNSNGRTSDDGRIPG